MSRTRSGTPCKFAIYRLLLAVACGGAALTTGAAEPTLKWFHQAQSNLYAPPLASEMHPAPGLETVICDSEAKVMRGLDARGEVLWEYKAGWKRRLISAPALSRGNLLLIANGDGTLRCINAQDGAEHWQRDAGPVEWGGALWSDLDGDGIEEAVAGTLDNGVVVFDTAGNPRWRFHRASPEPPLHIDGPLSACDADGDGRIEIFGVSQRGPFCLGYDGALRWETMTGDEFLGGPALANVDCDDNPEVFAVSRNDNFLWCLDARDGVIRWRAPLLGTPEAYSASAVAIGDLDRNAYERPLTPDEPGPFAEVAVGDSSGHLHAFTFNGVLRWTFTTGKPAPITATLGDVDGDGEIEVLAASGDHTLYCLDKNGRLKGQFTTDLRLIYPPTLADIDEDGKTEILLCGSDHTLRCLTFDGTYRPYLMVWPSRRYDAAQSGASIKKDHALRSPTIAVKRTLLLEGGFELGKTGGPNADQRARLPRGWHAENTLENMPELGPQPIGVPLEGWFRDTGKPREGQYALHTTAELSVASDIIAVDQGLRAIQAAVFAFGPGASGARLRYFGPEGFLRETPLVASPEKDGWRRFSGDYLIGNEETVSGLQLALEADAGDAWWDSATLDGTFYEPPKVDVLINQVGYEIGAPKAFVVQTTQPADRATFVLIRDGEEVFQGPLEPRGRITGHYGNDWGYDYWRGDFSEFNAPGTYRIQVTLGDLAGVSYPFQIEDNLLWKSTARPAYRFFYYQRCGMAIPGFHGACHLDDAVSPDGKTQHELWGGWHDAGDYNTYHNAPYVYGLLRAYGTRQAAFDAQDEDHNGASDFLDEIRWGAEHSRRMIAPDGSAFGAITSGYGFWGPPELETDNIPGTGDERPLNGQEMGVDPGRHQAAMARIATYVQDSPEWVAAAERSLRWSLDRGKRGLWQFSAALDLYAVTRDAQYAALARELFPDITASAEIVDTVRRFDALFQEDHTEELRAALTIRAEEILALAENPFGVYAFGPREKPNFFNTPADPTEWHVGTSTYLFEAANLVALAYQYAPDPRYLAFIYDQFNWTLGVNPFNISLVEGCGSAFPPTYHHRYTFAGVPRGAVPGSVVNGITWRGPGDDRPAFDMTGLDIPAFQSNEVWLPHNTAYLNALANLDAAWETLAGEAGKPSEQDNLMN